MKKLSKFSFPVLILISITLGCLGGAGAAYAAISFGILHEHHFYDLNYVYRNGWECVSEVFPTLSAHSYMWVRNSNRDVGGGAIFSQAGLTNINAWTQAKDVVYGPGIWNSGTNPAGHAVESHGSEMIPMYTSVIAWGNGFVRDPYLEYHHCPTEENTVFVFQ